MPRITPVFEFWPGDWFFGVGLSVMRGFVCLNVGPAVLGIIIERKGDDRSCIHRS